MAMLERYGVMSATLLCSGLCLVNSKVQPRWHATRMVVKILWILQKNGHNAQAMDSGILPNTDVSAILDGRYEVRRNPKVLVRSAIRLPCVMFATRGGVLLPPKDVFRSIRLTLSRGFLLHVEDTAFLMQRLNRVSVSTTQRLGIGR
jgi:hypothetical protein